MSGDTVKSRVWYFPNTHIWHLNRTAGYIYLIKRPLGAATGMDHRTNAFLELWFIVVDVHHRTRRFVIAPCHAPIPTYSAMSHMPIENLVARLRTYVLPGAIMCVSGI